MTQCGPQGRVFPCFGLKCTMYVLASVTASEAKMILISRLYIIRRFGLHHFSRIESLHSSTQPRTASLFDARPRLRIPHNIDRCISLQLYQSAPTTHSHEAGDVERIMLISSHLGLGLELLTVLVKALGILGKIKPQCSQISPNPSIFPSLRTLWIHIKHGTFYPFPSRHIQV